MSAINKLAINSTSTNREPDVAGLSGETIRQALDASKIGLWVFDLSSGLLDGNAQHCHHFGILSTSSPLRFDQWLALMQRADRPAVTDAWRTSLAQGQLFKARFRITDSTGREDWLEMIGQPELDEQGHVVRYVGTIRSIFDEKSAELYAARSKRELLSLFELSAVGMVQADPVTGRFLKVNTRFAEITGHSPEELLDRSFDDLVHPDDRSQFTQLQEAIERGDTERWEIEQRLLRPAGDLVWVHVSGRLMLDTDGKRYRTVASIVDISERKHTERVLRESEERYRAVVESQSEMVCRFRADGTILFVNRPYASARKRQPEQMIGENFWDFIPELDRPVVQELLNRLTRESPEVRIENQFQTAEGIRWTLWTNRALEFESTGVWSIAQSTGIDITDRKRAEAALFEADRRKDEFLATLAHELRNPLAPIRNAVQILNLRGPRDPILQESRDMIDRQLNHMVRLIDDLLDLSRITRGKLELRCELLELATVVDQAVESSQPLIKASAHELILSLPSHPVRLHADPVRLAQVFSNLLNNAAKYTERSGRIWLTALVQGDELLVSVRDTGIGIASEHLSKLFQMFSQVQSAQQRSQGGLGIGLSLVRGLVEMHGGTVEARSEGLGCGSEFVVRLPLPKTIVTGEGTSSSTGDGLLSRTPARRILVADDNCDSAVSLAMLLRLTGNEVEIAHDGQEAYDCADRWRPDIVLLDLGMPKVDGCSACRRIREQPWGRDMILIAQTGWGSEADRLRTREAGFDGHLVKPIAFPALMAMLTELDQHSHSPPKESRSLNRH